MDLKKLNFNASLLEAIAPQQTSTLAIKHMIPTIDIISWLMNRDQYMSISLAGAPWSILAVGFELACAC